MWVIPQYHNKGFVLASSTVLLLRLWSLSLSMCCCCCWGRAMRRDRVHKKKVQLFFKDFSRAPLDFLGPPTRNIISQLVHKCTFPVYSNKATRCFNTVFQRLYRYFSNALKVLFSLSDRYKIFTSNWIWIEICENKVLNKIDITMTTKNKNLWNW